MLPSDFFDSLPPDVVDVVSQRTALMPISSPRAQTDKTKILQQLNETSEWQQRFAANPDLACSAMSGVWLWFGFLDKAHQLCQDIPTAEGSYWHGIMHRIEGDYWNAKYWMRRVGNHEVHRSIPEQVGKIANHNLDANLQKLVLPQSKWSAEGFVDACETANLSNHSIVDDCKRLATSEWICLMQYCLGHIQR